jgi:cysteine desulfurase family protein (TIGR01976 family)
MATLINASDPAEIIMGSSTTALLQMLARCMAQVLGPGDEIIVSNGDHESNIAPWLGLQSVGIAIKFWNIDPVDYRLSLDELARLMSPRTRLVSVTHTSNILGTVNPIRSISDIVHENNAMLCVDGVAYAPHRAIDVIELGADFYVFSCYKTFGPHHGLLYGKLSHLQDLPSQNHRLVGEHNIPYKFQPGNVNYELSYGMTGLMDYLEQLGATDGNHATPEDGEPDRARTAVVEAFSEIAEYEQTLSEPLLDFLCSKSQARIVGNESADRNERVSIISFTVDDKKSADVVRRVDEHKIGIRFGNFYSERLVDALGIPTTDGVVRVSMVHYNTVDEVGRLIDVLDGLF